MVAVSEWESSGNVHVPVGKDRPPRPHHRTVARLAAARLSDQGRFLDLGCGLGEISSLVSAAHPEAEVAVADAYQVCLERTAARVGRPVETFLLDEADFDPPARIPGQFDVVAMSHVIEHLRDPATGLERALAMVKPGGVLVLAAPNPARPEVLLNNLFRRHYVNRGHVCAWDPSHWRNFLERIMGLDVEEYAADAVYLLPGAAGRAIAAVAGGPLARLAPWWAFSNIAVVRKAA